MANCQSNMQFMRQGNMMQQRPSCRCGMEERRMERKEPQCDMRERRDERSGSRSCGCHHKEDRLQGMPLAMAYVPWQKWRSIYDVSKGFHRGTIFEELDKPFLGRGGCNR